MSEPLHEGSITQGQPNYFQALEFSKVDGKDTFLLFESQICKLGLGKIAFMSRIARSFCKFAIAGFGLLEYI